LYKDTEYSECGSGFIVLQLNRTETAEQKYAIVCNDEKTFNMASKPQWMEE